MTNPPPPELFPQRPIHSESTSERPYRMRRLVTLFILFVVIGAGLYLKFGRPAPSPTEIPTIQAEGEFKEKPEQPGGIPIPNQDVTAYQQLDNSNAKPEAEHLLPPPETPQAPPAVVPPTANAAPADQAQNSVPKIETLEPPAPPQMATTVMTPGAPPPAPSSTAAAAVAPAPLTAPAPALPPVTAAVVAPPAPVVTPPAKASKAAETTPKGKSGYRVQLASIQSEADAESAAKKLQTKYASTLGKAKLHLAKADLGARGVFYRVQSNPLSEAEARDICASLKSAKAGCLIVRP